MTLGTGRGSRPRNDHFLSQSDSGGTIISQVSNGMARAGAQNGGSRPDIVLLCMGIVLLASCTVDGQRLDEGDQTQPKSVTALRRRSKM